VKKTGGGHNKNHKNVVWPDQRGSTKKGAGGTQKKEKKDRPSNLRKPKFSHSKAQRRGPLRHAGCQRGKRRGLLKKAKGVVR